MHFKSTAQILLILFHLLWFLVIHDFLVENMLPFNCTVIFSPHGLFPPMNTDSSLMLFLINLVS